LYFCQYAFEIVDHFPILEMQHTDSRAHKPNNA